MEDYIVNEILKPKNILDIVLSEYEIRGASKYVIDEDDFKEIIEILKGKETEFYKHPQGLVFDKTVHEDSDFDYHQRKKLKRRKFYGRQLTGDGSFYDYDILDFEKSVREDNINFLFKEYELFDKISKTNNLNTEEQREGHLLIELDFELFIIEKIINFLSETNSHFKRENDLANSFYETICKFCEINGVNKEVEDMLLKIADNNSWLGSLFFNRTLDYIVSQSNYLTVFESEKGWYEKEIGFSPYADSFKASLGRRFEYVLDLFSHSTLKEYLAEHIFKEVSLSKQFYENAKNKQQTLIDIMPHQTLSIETTSATVEEGKKDEIIDFVKDINPCIEFDDLFRGNVKGKIEIWNYMILLKMIDQDGNYIPIGKTAIIRAFVVLMRKHFKLPIAKSPEEMIRIFGLKLSIKGVVRVRPKPEIDLKEQELVKLLNASETKTLTFSYIA